MRITGWHGELEKVSKTPRMQIMACAAMVNAELFNVYDGSVKCAGYIGDEGASLMNRCSCVGHYVRSDRKVQGDRFAGFQRYDIVAGFDLHGGTGVVDEGDLDGLRLGKHCVYGRMNAGSCVNSGRCDQRGGNSSDGEEIKTIHFFTPSDQLREIA